MWLGVACTSFMLAFAGASCFLGYQIHGLYSIYFSFLALDGLALVLSSLVADLWIWRRPNLLKIWLDLLVILIAAKFLACFLVMTGYFPLNELPVCTLGYETLDEGKERYCRKEAWLNGILLRASYLVTVFCVCIWKVVYGGYTRLYGEGRDRVA